MPVKDIHLSTESGTAEAKQSLSGGSHSGTAMALTSCYSKARELLIHLASVFPSPWQQGATLPLCQAATVTYYFISTSRCIVTSQDISCLCFPGKVALAVLEDKGLPVYRRHGRGVSGEASARKDLETPQVYRHRLQMVIKQILFLSVDPKIIQTNMDLKKCYE